MINIGKVNVAFVLRNNFVLLTEREINSPDDDIFSQMDDEELCRLEHEAEQTGTAFPQNGQWTNFKAVCRKEIFSATGLCGKTRTG